MSDDFFKNLLDYETPVETESTALVTYEAELEQDFKQARENLKELAELAQNATQDMAKIAKQMESPGAYGHFSKLLAASILAQKAIVELHKNKIDGGAQPEAPQPQVVNQTLILTTAEMAEKLEEARKQLASRD